MSDQMKAAIYSKAKLGKILEITDLEQPVPKDNEVLLRVRAASVNPLDWRMKSPHARCGRRRRGSSRGTRGDSVQAR